MGRITDIGKFFPGPVSLLVLLASLLAAPSVRAETFALKIQVVHAHNSRAHVDAQLRTLVQDFPKLAKKFRAFELKDHGTFNLHAGATGRMQLPNGRWMNVVVEGLSKDKKLRIRIEAKELKFTATAAVDPGATLAVGGPPYDKGSLILVLTRPKLSSN